MTESLPFLLSVPHGGLQIPPDLLEHCLLDESEILIDSDTCSREIYDLSQEVNRIVIMDLARCVLDVNRSKDELPPRFPDGLIKERSVTGKKVFSLDLIQNRDLLNHLLDRYDQYHGEIARAVNDKRLAMAFDCHTMMPTGPFMSPDPGKPRPLVNLGDNFGQSCPGELTRTFREILIDVTGFEKEDVRINKPFSGGYLTRHYGMNPLPWIQIELNKKLYMKESGPDALAIEDLNRKIKSALREFYDVRFSP